MDRGFSGSTPFQNQHLWHSRGYINHYEGPGFYQLITYRLGDSLPQALLDKLNIELLDEEDKAVKTRKRKLIENYLDSSYGSCLLGNVLPLMET